jgi:putative addiction module killer protein
MIEIQQSVIYQEWYDKLRDQGAKARIDVRLIRLSQGNPGDVKPVGEGVSELRIDYGPGYRIYFVPHGDAIVVLLAGGVKKSQPADIRLALELAKELKAKKR